MQFHHIYSLMVDNDIIILKINLKKILRLDESDSQIIKIIKINLIIEIKEPIEIK